MTEFKTCSCCGREKPANEFYRNGHNEKGEVARRSKCIRCVRDRIIGKREYVSDGPVYFTGDDNYSRQLNAARRILDILGLSKEHVWAIRLKVEGYKPKPAPYWG